MQREHTFGTLRLRAASRNTKNSRVGVCHRASALERHQRKVQVWEIDQRLISRPTAGHCGALKQCTVQRALPKRSTTSDTTSDNRSRQQQLDLARGPRARWVDLGAHRAAYKTSASASKAGCGAESLLRSCFDEPSTSHRHGSSAPSRISVSE